MPQKSHTPVSDEPRSLNSPVKSACRGRQVLLILLLGWFGIAFSIVLIRGLIVHPTGLILAGCLLAIGWLLACLLDLFMKNES